MKRSDNNTTVMTAHSGTGFQGADEWKYMVRFSIEKHFSGSPAASQGSPLMR